MPDFRGLFLDQFDERVDDLAVRHVTERPGDGGPHHRILVGVHQLDERADVLHVAFYTHDMRRGEPDTHVTRLEPRQHDLAGDAVLHVLEQHRPVSASEGILIREGLLQPR